LGLNTIKLVVFDLDGTLLDSVPDIALATNQTLQALRKAPLSEAQIRDFVGNGADVLLARALSGSMCVSPQLDHRLHKEARRLFDIYYAQTGHQSSQLYPGVIATLDALKAMPMPMVILTNKPSQFVPGVLEQHKIAEYFCKVLGGDAFAAKKPDPMALNWLQAKYQLQPQQILMVGDSKHDIQAAKNSGCMSFGLTYGYNHGEPISDSEPDYVADDLTQLLHIFS